MNIDLPVDEKSKFNIFQSLIEGDKLINTSSNGSNLEPYNLRSQVLMDYWRNSNKPMNITAGKPIEVMAKGIREEDKTNLWRSNVKRTVSTTSIGNFTARWLWEYVLSTI